MKKRLLKTAAFLFAACGFAPQAVADSEFLDAQITAGDSPYVKVEGTMPENLSDYYFIITEQNQDIALTCDVSGSRQVTGFTWWYRASEDPVIARNQVWMIEEDNSEANSVGYAFRSMTQPENLLQTIKGKEFLFRTGTITEPRGGEEQFLLAYDEAGFWTIESGISRNNYLGRWDAESEPAANNWANGNGRKGQFVIYSILKSDYNAAVKAKEAEGNVDVTSLMANPTVYSTNGWINGRTYHKGQYNGAPDNILLDINSEPRDIYQVINVRPGIYKLTAATRGKSDLPEGYIYINNTKADIEKKGDQGNELGNGWNWTITNEAPVFGNQAKIGFYARCSNVNGNAIWASADDFKLEFVRELTDTDRETTVDVTVTEAGWATLMLPFAAEIPDGLTAYTCEGVTAQEDGTTSLNLTSATDLEANTPYIIQGISDTYTFEGTVESTIEIQYENGMLVGTYVPMAAEVGSYVLQNQDGQVGFYKVEAGAQPLVDAYRVYLKADEATLANVNMFTLDLGGNVTGIETTVAEDGNTLVDVYSISGVLVRKGVKKNEALNGLQKGIYVVDGVKKAVK